VAQKLQNVLPLGIVQYGMREGISAGNITATDTAAKIPDTPLTDRKSIMIRNDSDQTAYVGASNVTKAGLNGMLVKNGETLSIDAGANVDVYVVLATGTGTVYYLEGG